MKTLCTYNLLTISEADVSLTGMSPLTVKHILIGCTCFGAACRIYLGVGTLKKLFQNVEKLLLLLYNVVFISSVALIVSGFYLFFYHVN